MSISGGTARIAVAVLLASTLGTGTAAQGRRGAPPPAPAPGRASVPMLAHTQYALANGLRVVVHENHAAPIVSVQLWYHVGSKDDPPGRGGLAHLVEHVMGEGSANAAPREMSRIVIGAGGLINATTTEDRTQYYSVVPSNMLETVLWLEADRMGSRLRDVTQTAADTERPAIRNERGSAYETPPFGLADLLTPATLFPRGHPYHLSPLGALDEVAAATLEDMRAFAARYYVPANAVLVIAGDVDPAEARRWVDRYFGPIPKGPAVERAPFTTAALTTEKRVVLEDPRPPTPRIRFAWHGASTRAPDKPAMQMLAKVLGAGRSAILQRALVTDRPLATLVRVGHFDLEHSGIFQIEVTPRAGTSLTDIERAVDSVLALVRSRPVDAEQVRRAVADSMVASVIGLQLTKARADVLGEGVIFHGDPAALLTSRERFAAVTPADVQRVASRYLGGGRMVMSMVPAGKLDLVSKPELPFVNITNGVPR